MNLAVECGQDVELANLRQRDQRAGVGYNDHAGSAGSKRWRSAT